MIGLDGRRPVKLFLALSAVVRVSALCMLIGFVAGLVFGAGLIG